MKQTPLIGLIFSVVCLTAQGAYGLSVEAQAKTDNTPLQVRQFADAYAGGVGVPVNLPLALTLYQQAADLGDREAAFSAGYRLFVGVSDGPNEQQAIRYFKLAADKQHPAAMLWLGMIHKKNGDLNAAESLLRQSAALKVPGALDSWVELVQASAVTTDNLKFAYDLLDEKSGLSPSMKVQIADRNYLPVLGKEEAVFLQKQLTGYGFDTKGVDGAVGPNTQKALTSFRFAQGRRTDAGVLTIVDMKELGFF